ncbi:uncharacterized protein METZ01_LOCUS488016, partial [marine metagenome]
MSCSSPSSKQRYDLQLPLQGSVFLNSEIPKTGNAETD